MRKPTKAELKKYGMTAIEAGLFAASFHPAVRGALVGRSAVKAAPKALKAAKKVAPVAKKVLENALDRKYRIQDAYDYAQRAKKALKKKK